MVSNTTKCHPGNNTLGRFELKLFPFWVLKADNDSLENTQEPDNCW